MRGRSKPERTSKKVDLPAPFGPMRPWIVPGRTATADVVQRLEAAEGYRYVARFEDGRRHHDAAVPLTTGVLSRSISAGAGTSRRRSLSRSAVTLRVT